MGAFRTHTRPPLSADTPQATAMAGYAPSSPRTPRTTRRASSTIKHKYSPTDTSSPHAKARQGGACFRLFDIKNTSPVIRS